MHINMIFARAANGVIGIHNAMPWHLPEDLAHFKKLTLGHPVIMGRKTWDSIPSKFRPLPGRTNVVVTRQKDWQADGAQTAASLQDALALCQSSSEVWIIGGAQIYAQAEPLASRIEVTHIHKDYAGDAFAPTLSKHWQPGHQEDRVSSAGLNFSFITYTKQKET
jgi:dihydrofolate reductase